jgi:hypothetical protein
VVTESTSHAGFDNDVASMNSLLRAILGEDPKPANRFSRAILDY